MAQKFTEYLGIDEKIFADLGTFNPVLKVDTKFFIDPKSLIETDVPEFKDAHNKIRQRCEEILKLLLASSSQGDRIWRQAYKHFPKGEVSNLCIGYGFDNISGRGIGPKTATEILLSLKEFLNAGIDDPILFELIGIFQEDVGSDLISDFIARILIENLCVYTDRIVKQIDSNVKPAMFKLNGKNYLSYLNRYKNNEPVLLVPAAYLQPLPVANDWSDIDIVCQFNEQVRKRFAELVGFDTWKSAIRYQKKAIKKALIQNPEAASDLLTKYKEKPPKDIYDYKNDPVGEYSWQRLAKEYTEQNPLQLEQVSNDEKRVADVVTKIVKQYQNLIENNGLWYNLYDDNKNVMHESHSQKLFFGIADSYCEANNLDISPETNSGRGPIDFKFSSGRKAKVLVEIKLTKNPKLDHGLTIQLKEYEKAEKPYKSFLIVISVTDQFNYQEKLNKSIVEKDKAKVPLPEIIYVNGNIKKSASKS
jgi:hypothetical protein